MALKGHKAWNKGLHKYIKTCPTCDKDFVAKCSRMKFCCRDCYYKSDSLIKRLGKYSRTAYRTSKNGFVINHGYKYIYKPEHPFAKEGKYVFEHRLVMEKQIGRYLNEDEVVHHINKDTLDNRIVNLLLMNREEHSRLHSTGRKRKVI
jgi:hypothetical protein